MYKFALELQEVMQTVVPAIAGLSQVNHTKITTE